MSPPAGLSRNADRSGRLVPVGNKRDVILACRTSEQAIEDGRAADQALGFEYPVYIEDHQSMVTRFETVKQTGHKCAGCNRGINRGLEGENRWHLAKQILCIELIHPFLDMAGDAMCLHRGIDGEGIILEWVIFGLDRIPGQLVKPEGVAEQGLPAGQRCCRGDADLS